MRFIEPPHLILRKHLIDGVQISTFAEHVAQFSAKTLFNTSLLALEGGAFRHLVSEWSRNTAMCALTEGVIFTDPYRVSAFNHWTTPQLDAYAEGLRNDSVLKLVVSKLKEKFLGHAQALLHGDLHTGSVMAHEGSTFVIDPEFAFMGPIGFDIGAFLANLFLNYFSQASKGAQGKAYSEWILKQILLFHGTFESQFLKLWNDARARGVKSEQFSADVYNSDQLFTLAQTVYLRGLYADSLGFMALKMIRRIVGIAHVADLESIADAEQRSACEKRALNFARKIAIASQDPTKLLEFQTLDKVVDFARNWFVAPSPATWDM